MSDAMQFILSVGFLLSIIFVTTGTIQYLSDKHEEHMASIGYVEVQALGTTDTLWVKGD